MKDINSIERVQKRAAHWICSKWDPVSFRWNKSYDQALSELWWPTILQRHTILSCCQTYKIVKSLDCINFDHYFSYVLRTSKLIQMKGALIKEEYLNEFTRERGHIRANK